MANEVRGLSKGEAGTEERSLWTEKDEVQEVNRGVQND